METISNAGLAIGILAKDGIVLTAEKMVTSKLLDQKGECEKIHKLCEYVQRNALKTNFF